MNFVGTLTALLSVIASAFLAIIPLLVRRGGAVVEGARREDDVYPCLPIPADVWLEPDAYLYSQPALMAMGIAVTWDNPDVRIIDSTGATVGSYDLLPSTQYRIQATIHNRSAAAPAPGMPVIFAPTGFGAGAPILTPVGTVIDLPVQGAAGEPATAEVIWTTPPTPGHYCIVITAVWPDDAHPIDNVGQHNTVIRDARPGEALDIVVPVFAPPGERAKLRASVDAYVLPRAPVELGAATIAGRLERRGDEASEEERRLAAIVSANARGRFPAPDGWQASVTPAEVDVEAGGPGEVRFRATVPIEATAGSEQRFNVIVTEAETGRSVGGVTVIVNVV